MYLIGRVAPGQRAGGGKCRNPEWLHGAHNMHWSAAFLGWHPPHSDGPCWQFFRHVQAARFGRELPVVMVPVGLRDIAQAVPSHAAEWGWQAVDKPETGDGVLMAHYRFATHLGVYVGDLPRPHVLHCVGQTVGLHDFPRLDMARWKRCGFYRPALGA